MQTRRFRWRLGPLVRISLGLTALLLTLALVSNLLLNAAPDSRQVALQGHRLVADRLALQLTSLLAKGDESQLAASVRQILQGRTDPGTGLRSITVKRVDGTVVLQQPDDVTQDALVLLRTPVSSAQEDWGEIEFGFDPPPRWTVQSWFSQTAVQMLIALGVGGFLLTYCYLRRVMQFLDPSKSVPDRVRKAFDTLTEGVVILDRKGRIVLANDSFRRLHPLASSGCIGQEIGSLGWLAPNQGESQHRSAPWTRTLLESVTVKGERLTVNRPELASLQLQVTSAPITDDRGVARGCLVTFDDVSAVHLANDELRSALTDLQASRELIEEQNRELRLLAAHDSLTGCLNRRAFFGFVHDAFETSRRDQSDLSCIMIDIDRFKPLNDRHGHAFGDRVIQAVARTLSDGIRRQDALCRYGGEEFCIALPGTSLKAASAIAEKLRHAIETEAILMLRDPALAVQAETEAITASVGLSWRSSGMTSLEQLIDQADKALYQSKADGRNRVTVFEREAA